MRLPQSGVRGGESRCRVCLGIHEVRLAGRAAVGGGPFMHAVAAECRPLPLVELSLARSLLCRFSQGVSTFLGVIRREGLRTSA